MKTVVAILLILITITIILTRIFPLVNSESIIAMAAEAGEAEIATPTSEERVAKIEGILGQMNERLNHIEDRLKSLEDWIRWLLGIMITMWVTIILAILFKR